jgi:nitrogen-specific signal transduction histidine kinase
MNNLGVQGLDTRLPETLIPRDRSSQVDVNSLVSESVNLAYHGLRASDSNFTIALESDYDPTLPTIQGVPRDLSRVFLNMVNKAATRRIRKSLERGGVSPVSAGVDAPSGASD